MSDRRNGLYYESMGIRNHVLTRNIGEYMSYKHSMLENGGLAIGMPYAVETEFVPYTLSERAADGLHLTVLTGKMPNPRYNLAWRQGGLFGYTHEVINPHFDWIHRNQNLIESYFDYDSTEDLQERLDTFPSSLPWGQTGFLNGSESPGLRAYSSFNDPQNSEYFYDYTDFIRTIFTGGLSFDKQLGDHYLTNLLYDGFSKETIDTGVAGFIDEKAGFITDDIDAVLKPIEDTKLGYIGRILLGEEKVKQINGIGERGVIFEHKPISNLDEVKLGLGTGNENDYTIGISAYNEAEIEYQKFINDASEVLNDDLDFKHISFQEDLLRKQLRRNKYKNFHVGGDYGSKGSYADYYNIRDYGSTLYVGEEGDEISSVVNGEMRSETLGDSVEGFFRGVGVYDSNLQNNEHYDEQDGINSGERDTLSRKISYNEIERLGLDNGYGFSSKSSSLLERTKKLFQEHKIKTLVGRFHTSADDNGATTVGLTQSALDPTYGISHGRNLLKLNPTYENGYDNPYCRVWTYHHQYAKMTDLIRPFTDGETFMDLDALQAAYPGRPILRNGGRESWASKTVLNRNGMVNIVPTRKIGKDDRDRVKAKQCMFSIENLAWKNVSKDKSVIDTGEIGPLGGRIMWFPPYNLQFNESVSVSWGSNDFIGRGERIYSYTNTERTGTLSFTILADHPSILDYWMNSDNRRNNQGRDKDADDQTVLRFFAGCENLEAEDQVQSEMEGITNEYYAIKENQENKPKDEMDKTSVNENDNTNPDYVAGPPEEFTKDNSISFYVFFPNNLSGIDFVSNPKVIVNYLVKGLNGFEFNPNLNGNPNEHVLPSTNVSVGEWMDNIMMDTSGPGYEMGRSGGMGLTDSDTQDDIRAYNGKKANDDGRSYIWGYGIDKVYVKQRLCGPHGAKGDKTMKLFIPNYYDNTDHNLNNEPNVYDEACAYSFMDVAEAITPKPANGGYNYSGLGDPERVDKVLEILGLVEGENNVKNGKGRKYYFSIAGGASVHGYQDKNVDLSTRRANFLKAWLEYCFEKNNLKVDYDEEAKIQVQTGIEGGEESLDINSESAKRGRYAKAVIYWNDEDIVDGTETDKPYEVTSGDTGDTREVLIDKDVQMKPGSDVSDEEAAESTRYTNTVALTDMSSTRYRDEERFFDMLKESDPVLYKHITDKVKYFDPVYHSITPEGFNSRLSFLHQCTRQGPTLSSSDLSQNNGFNGAGYAGNLSFGRAPVCVLRLGDFFNTRIIINTVQIQYETSQWDLNPEGIGVQPMLANVTLGFVFQGGSSLGGPIQRLQNAVSFNYYANQEVYDDRADVAVYGDDGNLDEEATLVWMPGYGNLNLGSVNTAIQAKDPVNKTVVDEIEKDKYVSLHHQQVKGNEAGRDTIQKKEESKATSGATGN